MARGLMMTVAPFMVVHGLLHLLGAAVYLGFTTIEGLPYKTTLLGGRWDVGVAGTSIVGLFWIVPAVGFVFATIGMLQDAPWWLPMLTATTVLSLMLTVLDWNVAYMGAVTDVVILVAILLMPRATAWLVNG